MQRAIDEVKKKYTAEELVEYVNKFDKTDIVTDGSDALSIRYTFELINK
jgi:hypothetical protein